MYTSLTLIDEHTLDITSINYKSQDKDILFPIFPFEILGNYAYVPVDDNGIFKMMKYNISTGKYETFGDFGTRVRSIFADEETNRLYVGEYEVYRSAFELNDNSFKQKYSYGWSSYLDITKINGKLCALTADFDGMNFIDFETNESIVIADGVNNSRYGNQFNYSNNGNLFVCVGGNGTIVIHDLVNNSQIGQYEVDTESRIISLAISNDADFIVIGTEDNGVFEYTPQTNKLVRSKQSKLIPVNNQDGKMIYSQVNGIIINELKKKYHFIVRDLVFVTADYEVVKTSVESEKVESINDIDLVNLKYDSIKIYDYMGREIKSIVFPEKLELENLDVSGPLFFNIIKNDNTKTYKYLNTK